MNRTEQGISVRADGKRSRSGNGGGCGRRCCRLRIAGCCPRSPSTARLTTAASALLRWAVGQANSAGGAETIAFDNTVFKTPQTITLTGTQLELSDTSGTETITGPGGRDGQRRRAEPGVPGRRGRHGVDLGTDDHRRQPPATAAACSTGGTAR